ncbi:hypothetical protein PIB30_094465 [Stylosanthes scabra]|uniref:Putative plant transposon protein domain-containing protein n=1 Tax=Stylosanthes scabra TaxID=79078 RepID=A0ABU6YT05_9FABA|nr:hypothetical protein [Stylosanthes scabra]
MESERHLPLPYTSFIRGKEINFSPDAIHRVLNLHTNPLPNVASYHERKNENYLRMNDILRDLCVPGAQWVMHDDGRPYFLRRTDLQPMSRGWYEFVTHSIMPTINRSEVNTERAMLVHSIIIGEDIQIDEIIVDEIYKFSKKTGIRSKLPFPGVILRHEAKASIPEDTMILVEPPINAKLMERQEEEEAAEDQQGATRIPQVPQFQQNFPPNFMADFNNSMAAMQLQSNQRWDAFQQRFDVSQEENQKSFLDINERMDKMDHQLNFLYNTNQFMRKDLLFPYQQTELAMRNMQERGIPVTLENLTIHRNREEKIQRERERHKKISDEEIARRAKELSKNKARTQDDSDEDEDDDEDEDED